jgi:hypothetical protein
MACSEEEGNTFVQLERTRAHGDMRFADGNRLRRWHRGMTMQPETAISARGRSFALARGGRLFIRRLHGRSTLIIVLVVTLVTGVAVAGILNGATLGGIDGRASTDDAYARLVRAMWSLSR